MPIEEIFPSATVKQVAFEIRFPNLFFLESRVGDFQVSIMKEFPESALLLRRHMVLAEGEAKKLEEMLAASGEENVAQKQWQFKSKSGVELSITNRNLSLVSNKHRSYNLGNEGKFRDAIQMACRHFFEVTGIPLVTRVGLRYIDDCPVPVKETIRFREYYNTALPLDRFPLEHAAAMDVVVVVTRDGHQMRYLESFKQEGEKLALTLDFDAWSENVEASKVLDVTDSLHRSISMEFERVVREPVLEIMRQKGRENHAGNG